VPPGEVEGERPGGEASHLFVRDEKESRTTGTLLGESLEGRDRDRHTGLHVEDARAGRPISVDAERDLPQGPRRPDRVEMAEDHGVAVPRAETDDDGVSGGATGSRLDGETGSIETAAQPAGERRDPRSIPGRALELDQSGEIGGELLGAIREAREPGGRFHSALPCRSRTVPVREGSWSYQRELERYSRSLWRRSASERRASLARRRRGSR
jgi:hypothetical protein